MNNILLLLQLMCVACLVTLRISQDDEVRLALLLQKMSREWSLLTSVTWDSVGGAFADAIYGGEKSHHHIAYLQAMLARQLGIGFPSSCPHVCSAARLLSLLVSFTLRTPLE